MKKCICAQNALKEENLRINNLLESKYQHNVDYEFINFAINYQFDLGRLSLRWYFNKHIFYCNNNNIYPFLVYFTVKKVQSNITDPIPN